MSVRRKIRLKLIRLSIAWFGSVRRTPRHYHTTVLVLNFYSPFNHDPIKLQRAVRDVDPIIVRLDSLQARSFCTYLLAERLPL
jgi:hypothetical protein